MSWDVLVYKRCVLIPFSLSNDASADLDDALGTEPKVFRITAYY